MTDLQEALRQLRKAPGFTATAVITLALGIGATTAIFTLVHQVMLKSLPVGKPEELWRIGDKIRCCNWGGYTQDNDGNFSLFSYEAYKNFRDHTPEFSDLAALQAGNAPLGVRSAGSQGPVDTRNGEYVSGNFFRTLGVHPWIGRLMTDADDQPGAPPVAVMSYHIWNDKYGFRSLRRGRQLSDQRPSLYRHRRRSARLLRGQARLAGACPISGCPLTTEPTARWRQPQRLKRPNTNWLDIVGRVRPGVNPKSLEAKLRVEFHDWLASHVPDMEPGEKQTLAAADPASHSRRRRCRSHARSIPGGIKAAAHRGRLCAAGRLRQSRQSHAGARLKERSQTSLRVALGASRGRLVRKALVESILLALIGGVLGIAVAYAGSQLILYLAFHNRRRSRELCPRRCLALLAGAALYARRSPCSPESFSASLPLG